MVNYTITGNSAGYNGGAVYGIHHLQLVNSVLWDNSPSEPGYFFMGEEPVIQYSVVEGGYPGDGNVDADPMLDDDLVPLPGSPVIDAADGDLAPETDIEDNPRFDDPDTPNSGIGDPSYSDLGAYGGPDSCGQENGHKQG